MKTAKEVSTLLNNPADVKSAVEQLLQKVNLLNNQIDAFKKEAASGLKKELLAQITKINGTNFLVSKLPVDDAGIIKDLAFQLKGEVENLFLVFAAEIDGKASVHVMISDQLVKEKGLHAGNIVKELAKLVDGSGGGQPFYASAGGKNPKGIPELLAKAKEFI
jgi:alanyl-tRNA synthetase